MRSCRRDEECSSSLRRASYKKLRKIGYFLSTMASISKKFIDFRLFTRARVSAGGRENPRVPVARGLFFAVVRRQMSNFGNFGQKSSQAGHGSASKTGFFLGQQVACDPQSHFSRFACLLLHVSACGKVFIPPSGKRA